MDHPGDRDLELIALGILLANTEIRKRFYGMEIFIDARIEGLWQSICRGKETAVSAFTREGFKVNAGMISESIIEAVEEQKLKFAAKGMATVLAGAIDKMDTEQLKKWIKACGDVS